MINLPNVTLLILNPAHGSNKSAKVLNHVMANINFAEVIHITDVEPTIPCAAKFVPIRRLTYNEAQKVQALELGKYFNTEFMMHIETDGFPINFNLWNDDFLKYDYIGAPWPKKSCIGNRQVGNGGCSIQSKRFREKIESLGNWYRTNTPSDVWFAQNPYIVKEVEKCNIKYAPVSEAIKFSFEVKVDQYPNWDETKSFAFHGKFPWSQKYLRIGEN